MAWGYFVLHCLVTCFTKHQTDKCQLDIHPHSCGFILTQWSHTGSLYWQTKQTKCVPFDFPSLCTLGQNSLFPVDLNVHTLYRKELDLLIVSAKRKKRYKFSNISVPCNKQEG